MDASSKFGHQMIVSIENAYTVGSTLVMPRTPPDAIACGFPSPAQDSDDGPSVGRQHK